MIERKATMPQTFYNFHSLRRVGSVGSLLLGIIWIASIFINGNTATPTNLLMISYFLSHIFLVASARYWETTRQNPDGTQVQVRRPLIGFRRCETIVGDEKGWDFDDGWSYEPACIRI